MSSSLAMHTMNLRVPFASQYLTVYIASGVGGCKIVSHAYLKVLAVSPAELLAHDLKFGIHQDICGMAGVVTAVRVVLNGGAAVGWCTALEAEQPSWQHVFLSRRANTLHALDQFECDACNRHNDESRTGAQGGLAGKVVVTGRVDYMRRADQQLG